MAANPPEHLPDRPAKISVKLLIALYGCICLTDQFIGLTPMDQPIKIAVVGLGRMGRTHAVHVLELAREHKDCTLAGLCDADPERAQRFAAEMGCDVPIFPSVEELGGARVSEATVIVTPTDCPRENAAALISRGQRVLLEKPLTGILETGLEFAAEFDSTHPDALMLGFQRRFDAPLQYARELANSGAIGRIFKVYSAVEDSNPAPSVDRLHYRATGAGGPTGAGYRAERGNPGGSGHRRRTA